MTSIARAIHEAAVNDDPIGVVEGHILNLAFCGIDEPWFGDRDFASGIEWRTYMLLVAQALSGEAQ